MIQQTDDKITLIVYDSPEPPKSFSISKKVLKTALISTPIVLVATLTTSLIYSVMVKKSFLVEKSKEPVIIQKLKTENEVLQADIQQLKFDRDHLTKKITESRDTTSSSDLLTLFSKPMGFQDRTALDLIRLDNIKHERSDAKITLSFDLHNNGPSNTKVTGRLFIVHYGENNLSFFPQLSAEQIMKGINFTTGESFVASRFRPSETSFPPHFQKGPTFFKILIFSNLGDLLHERTIGPIHFEGSSDD